jgi:AcrR family transcriptional regulator
LRLATIDEIKQVARDQMAREGAAALSLRAVAREMGMTPSALYRYFSSREDLLSALYVDAFNSLGAALRAAYQEAAGGRPIDEWVAVANAHRRWALEHPSEYALAFGTPIPGYTPERADMGVA